MTRENYNKIESGMSYKEVVELIGEPESCSKAFGVSSCEWKDGDAKVVVTFVSDQATIIAAEGLK